MTTTRYNSRVSLPGVAATAGMICDDSGPGGRTSAFFQSLFSHSGTANAGGVADSVWALEPVGTSPITPRTSATPINTGMTGRDMLTLSVGQGGTRRSKKRRCLWTDVHNI